MNTSKRISKTSRKIKSPFWQQPAAFWIGAGMLAELPMGVFEMCMTSTWCPVSINWLHYDPPSVLTVFILAIASFLFTAWVGHRLGLGD